MKTVALKYSDNTAPTEGTIKTHSQILASKGYVWFGKFGKGTNVQISKEILQDSKPRILLINSKQSQIHWAYVEEISTQAPSISEFPEYYWDSIPRVKTWFKIIALEEVSKDVLNEYKVSSSQRPLYDSISKGMGSTFIIEPVNQSCEPHCS